MKHFAKYVAKVSVFFLFKIDDSVSLVNGGIIISSCSSFLVVVHKVLSDDWETKKIWYLSILCLSKCTFINLTNWFNIVFMWDSLFICHNLHTLFLKIISVEICIGIEVLVEVLLLEFIGGDIEMLVANIIIFVKSSIAKLISIGLFKFLETFKLESIKKEK